MQHYTSRELLLIVSKHELSKLNKVKRGVVRSDFITALTIIKLSLTFKNNIDYLGDFSSKLYCICNCLIFRIGTKFIL